MVLFTTSPMLTMPASLPSRTTGTCRMRCSVIVERRRSTSSSGVQVRTSAVMIEETGASSRLAPRSCICRTTSRSETMPPMLSPSSETTSAPMLCSASAARSCRTVASGRTVETVLPLLRRMSLIRLDPPLLRSVVSPVRAAPCASHGMRPIVPGEARRRNPLLVKGVGVWTDPAATLHTGDRSHLLVVQREVENVDVLADPRRRHRTRNDHQSELHVPAQDHLSHGPAVLRGQFDEHGRVEQRAPSERAPGFGDDPEFVVERPQLGLLQLGV